MLYCAVLVSTVQQSESAIHKLLSSSMELSCKGKLSLGCKEKASDTLPLFLRLWLVLWCSVANLGLAYEGSLLEAGVLTWGAQ